MYVCMQICLFVYICASACVSAISMIERLSEMKYFFCTDV